MKELILTGVGIIMLIVVWHFVVRKTALDYFRDRLFDLREHIKGFYSENGRSLDDPTYRELRLLINNQIRFLDGATLTGLITCRIAMDTNPEFRECIQNSFAHRFHTKDAEIAAFILACRRRGYELVTRYILFASLGMTLLSLALFPIAMVVELTQASFRMSKKVFADALTGISRKTVTRVVVEECASHQHPLAA